MVIKVKISMVPSSGSTWDHPVKKGDYSSLKKEWRKEQTIREHSGSCMTRARPSSVSQILPSANAAFIAHPIQKVGKVDSFDMSGWLLEMW